MIDDSYYKVGHDYCLIGQPTIGDPLGSDPLPKWSGISIPNGDSLDREIDRLKEKNKKLCKKIKKLKKRLA